MTQRRWPLILALAVALLAAVAVGWAIGRATTSTTTASTASTSSGAVQIVNGIPVGVEHARAGALAASDNYVAEATQTLIQDPAAYARLVHTVYVPSYQQTAINQAQQARAAAPQSVQNYAQGGRTVVVVGARRLDAYNGTEAQTTTWTGGITWGPNHKPGQTWALVATTLRWDGQRWLVARLDQVNRPAPAPAIVGFRDKSALQSSTFDQELQGMTAPIYGDQ